MGIIDTLLFAVIPVVALLAGIYFLFGNQRRGPVVQNANNNNGPAMNVNAAVAELHIPPPNIKYDPSAYRVTISFDKVSGNEFFLLFCQFYLFRNK